MFECLLYIVNWSKWNSKPGEFGQPVVPVFSHEYVSNDVEQFFPIRHARPVRLESRIRRQFWFLENLVAE